MAHYSGEGGIQISRARLWEFLQLHSDPAAIGQIHPDVVHQSVGRSSGGEVVLERTLRVPRNRTLNSTWKVTSDPPQMFRWEIVAGEGPMEIGSWVENHYTDAPEGSTWVKTEAEISIQRIPRFLQKAAVRRVLSSIDAQDLAYLRAHP
ncbi:MAG: hypothetical protein WAN74_00050 [Thermoplasmata archaeon]